ncbi:MAG: ATP-dependent DNA ligase [Acidimicrobiales bacterium]|nr:ATP-dependent DNA ligase [Acidimicrobiales bacterium]
MRLPVLPPVAPMLARAATELPIGEGWLYEPKWDGFRCLVFRDGDEVELTSRNERPLTRYFPELLVPLRAQLPERCVLDGEVVVPGAAGLDFDALSQRIHPADSRVRRLAAETPAAYLAFDLLALGDRDLRSHPQAERSRLLATALAGARPPLFLTPSTTDPEAARTWFERFEGAGIDGVVAKPADLAYRSGERVLVKVKHRRTADCVVAGFRWHKDGEGAGSLLLGLYDDGRLQHAGVCTGFTARFRRELRDLLAPLQEGALVGHPWAAWASPEARAEDRLPGNVSRWNAAKDLSWEPVRLERVVEVRFDQLAGSRFRHATQFVRWRDDREPRSCTYAQLEVATPLHLGAVMGARPGR